MIIILKLNSQVDEDRAMTLRGVWEEFKRPVKTIYIFVKKKG